MSGGHMGYDEGGPRWRAILDAVESGEYHEWLDRQPPRRSTRAELDAERALGMHLMDDDELRAGHRPMFRRKQPGEVTS